MSDDLSNITPMEPATGPCAISDSSHQPPSPLSPTPQRVRTLAPLLTRVNVRGILEVSDAQVTISVRFRDGRTDSKIIKLAEGGSLAAILFDDNPDQVPSGAFYDVRPEPVRSPE